MASAVATVAPPSPRTRRDLVLRVAYLAVIGVLVVPRLHSGSALWLDETLSVNISRLPLPDLFHALRNDGSPPLYYLILHVWIGVLGTGDDAVRSLSTVCSVAALPVMYAVGRRLGGPATGAMAALLLAASPFAIRYATETRMYSLVVLLTLLAVLAVLRALESPTLPRLAAVAALAGLLSLTHYWCLFLLASGELLLLWLVLTRSRPAAARVALAVPAGGVLFLPWLPSFLFQRAHTGAPWAPPATVLNAGDTLRFWQGPGTVGWLGLVVVSVLILVGLGRPAGRRLAVVGLGALLLGLLVSQVQGQAYAVRYSAAVIAPVLLAAGIGAARLPQAARLVAGGLVVTLSLLAVTTTSLLGSRTQAAATAALLASHVRPGDLVVYCPDQLGPAVDRLLPTGTKAGVRETTYPSGGSPRLIDWVDYAARNAAASPADFARRLVAETTGTVWLVRADGFRTFGDSCADVDRALTLDRGPRTVLQRPIALKESAYVVAFPVSRPQTG